MRFEFKLPDIGEGVAEGEVVAWHVQQGDPVAEDQIMVEVMTDKATVTIGAPKAGKIAELRAQVGSQVRVGDVLVVIQTGNGSIPAPHPEQNNKASAASAVGDIQDSLPGGSLLTAPSGSPRRAQENDVEPALGTHYSEKPLATPSTRKLARDLGLDLRRVPPSGSDGRVTKEDVHAALEASKRASQPAPAPMRRVPSDRSDKRVPFVGLRRRIAERMQQAKNTAAHFTFVEECDASRLMSLRDSLKERAAAEGTPLTFLPFIVKAVCAALKQHPMLNSSLDTQTNELVMHGRCHIGMAAATEQGLVVPVIHDADTLDLFSLAREINRLGEAARTGKLTVAELSGSTFTVTSLGKQAGLLAVPILNLPNVGILGVHRIKERPVVRDGQIAIGQIMILSLSLDHRIVDGHVGAAFAYDVIAHLEEPALMFMNV
ncbi:MAG TPA: dihydrolipoamide acetyltransferase family protein [Polyangiales bacterium]|nr:dihydrolipoamide acetyltransferase family protein [Polyangiales bacterium]